MGDFMDTVKSFILTILKIIAAVTIIILIFIGPKDAADFVKWIGEIGSGVGQSGKEFINEVKE